MIKVGGAMPHARIGDSRYDMFVYGLGFETRSTVVASVVDAGRIIALAMPEVNIHAYARNRKFAHTRRHAIVNDFRVFVRDGFDFISKRTSPVSIAVDISSMNRYMMFSLVDKLASVVRPGDVVEILYSPAKYAAPDWTFPQIEKIGPISHKFTSYNADPLRPLCLVLGLGFEPGIAMGIISQLEPSLSYCFWGFGVDERFGADVKKANFDFEYPGFVTRTVSFPVKDPKSSYFLIESLTAGLMTRFNVVFVPMGPKIFSLISALIGLTYRGQIAVWRVQQRRPAPPDSRPGSEVVFAQLDCEMMRNSQHPFDDSQLKNKEFTS